VKAARGAEVLKVLNDLFLCLPPPKYMHVNSIQQATHGRSILPTLSAEGQNKPEQSQNLPTCLGPSHIHLAMACHWCCTLIALHGQAWRPPSWGAPAFLGFALLEHKR
jgi:hypothetical protein